MRTSVDHVPSGAYLADLWAIEPTHHRELAAVVENVAWSRGPSNYLALRAMSPDQGTSPAGQRQAQLCCRVLLQGFVGIACATGILSASSAESAMLVISFTFYGISGLALSRLARTLNAILLY